jgi:hypothetical protein
VTASGAGVPPKINPEAINTAKSIKPKDIKASKGFLFTILATNEQIGKMVKQNIIA